MTCHFGANFVACGPPPGVYRRRILHCPICKCRRRHIERWDGAWYGTTIYCACGDRWQDGELSQRPFERGWRKEAQTQFRAMWDNAAPEPLYREAVRADIACYIDNDTEADETAAVERYNRALRAISERAA